MMSWHYRLFFGLIFLQSGFCFAQGNIDIQGGSVTINAVNNTFITKP